MNIALSTHRFHRDLLRSKAARGSLSALETMHAWDLLRRIMHKDKSKESKPRRVDFPAGTWTISFGLENMENYPWTMGLINLIETEDPNRRYVGAIQFNEKVNIVDNTPFPLHIDFHQESGSIHFHILGAARDFDQDAPLPPEFHFMFNGTYEPDDDGNMTLSGTGGVPTRFCPPSKVKPGLPEEDGQTVNWTSEGHGDSHPKPSK
jgi:hypothetical protein